MGRKKSQEALQHENKDVTFSGCIIDISQMTQNESGYHYHYTIGGLFASVGQVGMGFGISPSPSNPTGTGVKIPIPSPYTKHVSTPEPGFHSRLAPELAGEKASPKKRNKSIVGGLRIRIKIGNESLRRLVSGGIAGSVSRTAVAPLETIKTHLMVGGSCGRSVVEVFNCIVSSDGWRGLYRGNLVNVVRVAPNKAIELFAYDTVKKHLTPKPGEESKIPVPASLVAGAVAGLSSTFFTYPLELLKTRLTVQRGVYRNFMHALTKIVADEGAAELYRGLVQSMIGVMPYAAANYFAYDTLQKAYRTAFNTEEIGNAATLLMGSAAAVASSGATFRLEVARKQMQAGAVNGRQYGNLLQALLCIVEREGVSGLYRGLGPSCMKLVPAAGISFMCYEACKRVMLENKEEF